MKLSEHFSLEEMIVTQVRGATNTVPLSLLPAVKDTAERMEEVRKLLGNAPITVTSGYRSPFVNKIVGGSITSAHMSGRAVDFICPSFGTPFEVAKAIAASDIVFDQLIYEETWVHISFDPKARREVLTKRRSSGYIAGLKPDTSTA